MPPKQTIPIRKVCVVGPTSVGKTSIIHRIQTRTFSSDPVATTSVAIVPILRTFLESQSQILINFWDTAGQERYKSMGPMYYQGASACLAVFDINLESTFEEMKDYINMFTEQSETPNPIVVICANKLDTWRYSDSINVFTQWAEDHECRLFQTSALSGQGLDEMLEFLTDQLAPALDRSIEPNIDDITIKTESESEKKCC